MHKYCKISIISREWGYVFKRESKGAAYKRVSPHVNIIEWTYEIFFNDMKIFVNKIYD